MSVPAALATLGLAYVIEPVYASTTALLRAGRRPHGSQKLRVGSCGRALSAARVAPSGGRAECCVAGARTCSRDLRKARIVRSTMGGKGSTGCLLPGLPREQWRFGESNRVYARRI